MAAIESWYHISRNQDSWCQVFLSLQSLDSRNSDKELNQRSRSLLILTAVIKSRNHISRFRGSCCQVFLSFQSPDPRYSMRRINVPYHFLIWRLQIRHDIAYRNFIISVALFTCLSMLRSLKLYWRHTWIDTCWILPRVTLIRDLHVPEVLNHPNTCHYLVVPRVPSWHGLLSWVGSIV